MSPGVAVVYLPAYLWLSGVTSLGEGGLRCLVQIREWSRGVSLKSGWEAYSHMFTSGFVQTHELVEI